MSFHHLYVAHNVSKGGLGFESLHITQNNIGEGPSSTTGLFAEGLYLDIWQKWVNNSDRADLWNQED